MTKKGIAIAKRYRVEGGRGFDGERQVDGSGEKPPGAFSVSIWMGRGFRFGE